MKRTNLTHGKLMLYESIQHPEQQSLSEFPQTFPQRQKRSIGNLLRHNMALVVLAAFLVGGVICGTLFIRGADFSALEKLDFLFFSNFQGRISTALTTVFVASLASSFCFIFLCFLCGLSMWGAFLIPVIPFFRGFGLGMTAGYLYAAHTWKGILFQLVVILPGAFLCCLAILLASREGIAFSKKMSFGSRKKEKETPVEGAHRMPMRVYIVRFMFIIGIALVAALVDIGTSACFAGLFSFT